MYDTAQKKKITENLSEWYNDIILRAGLAEYGPAKGTMIIKPYGYGIWEELQKAMDPLIKAKGVKNAYFPLFIPMSFLKKEANHVEGFSPELAVVTVGGGEELTEPLAVRPTSETIMYDAYSKWVQSWRDLPILINQWNNVVRWEKRSYLFLRTTEFLWQEGHTAHATHEESLEMVDWAIRMYAKVYREYYALPGFIGKKSESEKFAGANMTMTFEAIMPDGKALQSCTSHDLGQNFSKAFEISFQDKNKEKQYAWQTSWGFSTRSIGGLIMMHGDDKGLKLPPKIAPVQVIVLPVKSDDDALVTKAKELCSGLVEDGIRAEVDSRDGESLGFRINKWEVRGAPLRIEVGARDIESDSYVVARRDTLEKLKCAQKDLPTFSKKLLEEIQENLFNEAKRKQSELMSEAHSFEEFKKIMDTKRGFISAYWCEDRDCEAQIKEKTKATTRCLPVEDESRNRVELSPINSSSEATSIAESVNVCVHCGKPATHKWLFAQSY